MCIKLFNKIHIVRYGKYLVYFFLLSLFLYGILLLTCKPSHDRDWEFGQEELPSINFAHDGIVTINNFRNFDWQDATHAHSQYETITFKESDIESVDVLISHFDSFEGLAHIFISFTVKTGERIVVSLETRREKGEKFSPLLGLLRQYEIIYVVGSEPDIVGLRTNVRDERVYLYPTNASKEQAQALFHTLADDINGVYAHPRMYNTLMHNCTNEITRRVEDVSDVRFPLTWKTVLPGYFDEILHSLGVIGSNESFIEFKARHLIDNTTVDQHSPNFSSDIRMGK